MNKKKSIFVSALLSVLLLSLIAAMYSVSRVLFFMFLGTFGIIGFVSFSVFFCKWLERPSAVEEDTIDPPIVSRPEELVNGESKEFYQDINSIIDEVKRDAETEEE